MSNIAIIKIAGKGTRINSSVPKQYINVKGKPIFIYTLDVFNRCPSVDSICVVSDSEHLDTVKEQCAFFGINKARYFCIGGANGNLSTFNGLKLLESILSDNDFIISHDGVRSLVTEEIIEDSIRVAKEYGASIATYQTSGNILFKNDNLRYISRNDILIAQTPITISKKHMEACMRYYHNLDKEKQNEFAGLDDVILALGIQLGKSFGDSTNFKITTDNDLKMFCAIVGDNYDNQ